MASVLLALTALLVQEPPPINGLDPAGEPVTRLSVLSNGDFLEPTPQVQQVGGGRRVPWWRTSGGTDQLVATADLLELGALITSVAEWARQPFPADLPRASEISVTGQIAGRGVVVLHGSRIEPDGSIGPRVEVGLEVGVEDRPRGNRQVGFSGFVPFELTVARFEEQCGHGLCPRFELELRAGADEACVWRELEVLAPFPCPSEESLRAEIIAELEWIFGLWFELARDGEGPDQTAFLARAFDVVTGEPLLAVDGGHNVFFDLLFAASRVTGHEEWTAAFGRFLDDLFARSFHPDTGLPRLWDCATDQPKDDQAVEISTWLSFLCDLVEHGSEADQARALAAAQRIGEAVLRFGTQPDGGVAAKYRPRDGRIDLGVHHLRRLDVPAQIARLARLTSDERLLAAARDATAAVEYTHYWPGSWAEIDPGFDDDYGHYGRRASVMWEAWPDEPLFRRIARGGFTHYEQMWRNAMRLGGNIAADQIRCWRTVARIGRVEPELLPRIAPLLDMAVFAHFQGEQYGNGSWGDVTIFGFDPRDHLQVGDLPGVPQNLLHGVGHLYGRGLEQHGGPSPELLRSVMTATLRASRRSFRRPYGYLSTRFESTGHNYSRGSVALAVGLVEMLVGLEGR